MKYFSAAYLKNLSTHAQASPISELEAYHALLSWLIYLATMVMLVKYTPRFSFFKSYIKFSIHARHYYCPKLSVSFEVSILLPFN